MSQEGNERQSVCLGMPKIPETSTSPSSGITLQDLDDASVEGFGTDGKEEYLRDGDGDDDEH